MELHSAAAAALSGCVMMYDELIGTLGWTELEIVAKCVDSKRQSDKFQRKQKSKIFTSLESSRKKSRLRKA